MFLGPVLWNSSPRLGVGGGSALNAAALLKLKQNKTKQKNGFVVNHEQHKQKYFPREEKLVKHIWNVTC